MRKLHTPKQCDAHTSKSPDFKMAPDGPVKLTMDCFWVQQGWYRRIGKEIRLKRGKWDDPEICAKAVRFLVDIVLLKDPREVTLDDFYANRLRGLMSTNAFGNCVYKALKAAGYDLHPWEVAKTGNNVFKKRETRIEACLWLAEKVKKESGREPRDIIGPDFEKYGIKSLLTHHYNDSPYEALLDAGLVTSTDEQYMRSKNHGHNGK